MYQFIRNIAANYVDAIHYNRPDNPFYYNDGHIHLQYDFCGETQALGTSSVPSHICAIIRNMDDNKNKSKFEKRCRKALIDLGIEFVG